MIYLVMNDRKLLILEPGNLEHIREGGIAVTTDNSVAVAFCPDILWLQDEILKLGANRLSADKIVQLLKDGIGRKDVVDRPYHPTWDAAKKGGTA